MTGSLNPRDWLKSPALRLIAYFATLAVVLGTLALTVPWFARMLVPAPPGSEAAGGS